MGRTDSDGRTAGAYVLNPTPGETPPLELALRRPRKGRWFVRTVEGERPAQILRMSPDEVVVRLPPLAAWQPLLLAASSGAAKPKAAKDFWAGYRFIAPLTTGFQVRNLRGLAVEGSSSISPRE